MIHSRHGLSRRLLAVVVMATALTAACTPSPPTSSAPATDPPTAGATGASGRVLRVPGDAPSIQGAVDLARPGDLVLVAAGTYHEEVVVEKVDDVTIRGADRNRTILDGEHARDNGIKVFRNGVAVENLTIRNYKSNGIFFTGDFDTNFVLTGYRASYVTVHNNGDYGLYAFNATKGVFDHDYGSGHPDAAFYVGQCDPCDAVISDSLGERNMLGFTGTNASGVTIVRSEWRDNMIGLVPNSNDGEKLAPQRRARIVGNWVHDNTGDGVPISDDQYRLVWGNGILVTGGQDDEITRNLVERNPRGGIGIMMWPFRTGQLPAFEVSGNRVTTNVAQGNATEPGSFADLWLWTARASQGNQGNCFAENTYDTTAPADLEAGAPCDGAGAVEFPGLDRRTLRPGPSGIDHRDVPSPPDQIQMPDAATAPAAPALAARTPPPVDLDEVVLPTPTPGTTPGKTPGKTPGTAPGTPPGTRPAG